MRDATARQREYWNKESGNFAAIYTRRKSRFSAFLDRIFRRDMFERFVYTMEACKPAEGKTFLDVGCGTGLYTVELARMGAEKVLGIDISQEMVKLAEAEARLRDVGKQCEFHVTDLLPFSPAGEIHTSIGIGLFDYIREPLPVIKKMRDLSREKVIASFPRAGTWRMPVRKLRLALRGCPVYFYSRRKVEILMEAAGFRRYRLDKIGKLYCIVGYKETSG